jgi:hypothetical protein
MLVEMPRLQAGIKLLNSVGIMLQSIISYSDKKTFYPNFDPDRTGRLSDMLRYWCRILSQTSNRGVARI